jgi:beta-lactamase class A
MRALLVLCSVVLGLMAAPALAADKEIAALQAVLAPGPLDTGLFTADFLKAVPPAQLSQVLEQVKTQVGPVVAIVPKGGQSYLIETATHELLADIVLDQAGRIAGLLLHPAVAKNQSIDELLADIEALTPEAAYLVSRDGVPIYSSNPDKALAVGSGFKLGVLKALYDEIVAGKRSWSDVVRLDAADLSLPSGFLHTWPVGSPVTLHTLAALMISISDNTATDALMHTLGPDAIGAALGAAPVLTTRQLFVLKGTPALKARYVAADLAGKRQILAEADALPLPPPSAIMTPHDQGVEYYFSPARLCALLAEVGALDVTQINPGVAAKSDWASVSFKGGSEIGVLSFTTLATAKSGQRYCVSAVWNDTQAIDEAKAAGFYAGVLNKLSKGG